MGCSRTPWVLQYSPRVSYIPWEHMNTFTMGVLATPCFNSVFLDIIDNEVYVSLWCSWAYFQYRYVHVLCATEMMHTANYTHTQYSLCVNIHMHSCTFQACLCVWFVYLYRFKVLDLHVTCLPNGYSNKTILKNPNCMFASVYK